MRTCVFQNVSCNLAGVQSRRRGRPRTFWAVEVYRFVESMAVFAWCSLDKSWLLTPFQWKLRAANFCFRASHLVLVHAPCVTVHEAFSLPYHCRTTVHLFGRRAVEEAGLPRLYHISSLRCWALRQPRIVVPTRQRRQGPEGCQTFQHSMVAGSRIRREYKRDTRRKHCAAHEGTHRITGATV